jgi:uncharacterized protein (TIGR02646 family)
MRSIKKVPGSGQVLVWRALPPPQTGAEASAKWGDLDRKAGAGARARLLAELLDEQYGLCCYSEIDAERHGLGYHIEHVWNKRQYPALTFKYQNLAASALATDDLKHLSVDAFGGHAKGKQASVDVAHFVSCHQPDCHKFFAYLSDGRIVPSRSLDEVDKAKAVHTIDQLNLNSPFLMVLRQTWSDELAQLFAQHLADDWSLPHLAMVDLVPSGGRLNEFFSLTRQFYGQLGEAVLAEHAPELV